MKKMLVLSSLGLMLFLSGCSETNQVQDNTNTKIAESKKNTTHETPKSKEKEQTIINSSEDAKFIFYHQDIISKNTDNLVEALNNIKNMEGSFVISVKSGKEEKTFYLEKNGNLYTFDTKKKKVYIKNEIPLQALLANNALKKHTNLNVSFDHVEDSKLIFQLYEWIKNDEKTGHTATYDWVEYDPKTKKFKSTFGKADYSHVTVD